MGLPRRPARAAARAGLSGAPPSGAVADVDRLRADFERLARVECATRSPLSAAICRAVARDSATLALAMRAPSAQRRPTLLLAAIHDLLLAGAEHPLAAHVPTVAGGRTPSGRAGELALDFCAAHRRQLAAILSTRGTQTNEVNRVAALLPALAVATPPGAPLRLVELGASAGLNLLADRYEVRYDQAGGASFAVHGPRTPHHPPVVCSCAVRGTLPRDMPMPAIASRIGVDLAPIDVRDPQAVRWLLACTWPDEPDRITRLRAAIAVARVHPPTVVQGDGPRLLAELVGPDGGQHPVIWHSWVLAYGTPSEQRLLATAIDEIGRRRDVTWIYLEQHSETPGLPTPVVAAHDPADSALVAVTYRRGARTVQRLADAHPHARHMRWLASRQGEAQDLADR